MYEVAGGGKAGELCAVYSDVPATWQQVPGKF